MKKEQELCHPEMSLSCPRRVPPVCCGPMGPRGAISVGAEGRPSKGLQQVLGSSRVCLELHSPGSHLPHVAVYT